MTPNLKTIATLLIVAGALALIYRGFTYTRLRDVDIGPVDVQYEDRETLYIPVWAGVAAIGVGTLLLLSRRHA